MNNDYKLIYKQKRTEHEIIASGALARLDQVFTFGNPDLLSYSTWANMLVYGDNVPVLKSLLNMQSVSGNVRLVYIDPPFSTQQDFRSGDTRVATISSSQQDSLAYKDNLTGADFIEFLRERLVLLREILADNGSIYIHIDWKKGHYIKVIMDEIFGEDKFINDIARIKCNPKNFNRKAYGNIKDMILFYSKTNEYVWNEAKEAMSEGDIQRLFSKTDTNGRKYTTIPLHAPGETKTGVTGQSWRGLKPPKGRHWRTDPIELSKLDAQGLIEWSKTGNPRKIIYADDVVANGKKRQDIWDFKDSPYPDYPTQKNEEMLKTIEEASSNTNDIVLDCFAGSGTTLVSAEKIGRRWIGIDMSEIGIQTTLHRLLSTPNVKPFTLYNATGQPLPQSIEVIFNKKCT